MATIIELANSCPTYFKIKEALSNDKHPASLPPDHPARCLNNVWHELSVSEEGLLILSGTRVFIPIPLRTGILKLLHKGHMGLQKTWAKAKSLYFWPNMRSHIQQEIDKCEPCQSLKPSLPKEPLINTTASFPMEKALADLFQFRSQHYLVLVDRYSGFPMVSKLRNLSSATVIRNLTELFDNYGWPLSIRTDGGPQFRTEFKTFCVPHDINHELSSPYHLESNGHAESVVKNVKHLMEKVKPSEFPSAFATWKKHKTGKPAQSKRIIFRASFENPVTAHAFHSLSGYLHTIPNFGFGNLTLTIPSVYNLFSSTSNTNLSPLSNTNYTNYAVVFGIPIITTIFSLLGLGPFGLTIMAWLLPIILVTFYPSFNTVTNVRDELFSDLIVWWK